MGHFIQLDIQDLYMAVLDNIITVKWVMVVWGQNRIPMPGIYIDPNCTG